MKIILPPQIKLTTEEVFYDGKSEKASAAWLTNQFIMPIVRDAENKGFKRIILANIFTNDLKYFFIDEGLYESEFRDNRNYVETANIKWKSVTTDFSGLFFNRGIPKTLEKAGYKVITFPNPNVIIVDWKIKLSPIVQVPTADDFFQAVAMEVLKSKHSHVLAFQHDKPGLVRCLSPPPPDVYNFKDFTMDLNTLISERHNKGYDIAYGQRNQGQTVIFMTVTMEMAIKMMADL